MSTDREIDGLSVGLIVMCQWRESCVLVVRVGCQWVSGKSKSHVHEGRECWTVILPGRIKMLLRMPRALDIHRRHFRALNRTQHAGFKD